MTSRRAKLLPVVLYLCASVGQMDTRKLQSRRAKHTDGSAVTLPGRVPLVTSQTFMQKAHGPCTERDSLTFSEKLFQEPNVGEVNLS